MNWSRHLSKLNPLNSLFGRIFLWFWLTTLIMIFVTATVVKEYISTDELQSIPAQEQILLDKVAEQINSFGNNVRPPAFRRNLVGLEREQRIITLLLRHSDGRIMHSRPMGPEVEARFRNLQSAPNAYSFLAHNHLFMGPKVVTINGQPHSLFIGKPLRFPLFQSNRTLLLGIAMLVSGILCFFLTWQLTQPIKQLRTATQKMAKGDLQAKVHFSSQRRDEIGQLSQDFNSMSDKVSTLMNSQKRLLADISHELRSPLARLQLAIGIAQEQRDETSVTAMISRVEKEAQQIDTMLGQVLQLSRLESQSQMGHFEPIALDSLLQQILEDASYEAASMEKALSCDMKATCQVNADAQLLASGIENVLRNAIKYAKHGVSVRVYAEQRHANIEISDDGDGVPEQDLPHLFSAFYRVSTARSRDNGGTGLGLAIAKQAINVHNGSINAQNSQDGGLVVAIRLPCA